MKTIHLMFLFVVALLGPVNSYAFKDECRKIVDTKKYLHKGDFDNKSPAEKIYNFDSIRNDLKEELVSSTKVDPKKVSCLNDLYQKGIDDAASYWGDRGQSEGCLSKGEIPKTRPSACDEKTWKEFKKSRKYLTSLQEDKKKMLRPLAQAGDKKTEECLPGVAPTSKSFDEIAKVADATRTNLCCGAPKDKLGVVKAVYPELNHAQCLAKISETNDEMISVKGLAMCTANIVATAIKTIWDSLKAAASFFTSPSQMIGAMSAVKELATNEKAREQFVNKLKGSVKQFISTRGATLNTCLNSYEQSMYICEVTGAVVGSIVDVGGVLKIVKALRYGNAGADIAGMLSKMPKGQKVLGAMKKAEDFATSSVGKAKSAVKESAEKVAKSLAKDARSFALAASLLKTDVGFDEQLLKQVKKAENNAKVRANTIVNETPKLSGSSPTLSQDTPKVDLVADVPETKTVGNEVRAAVLSANLRATDVDFDQQLAKQLKHADDNAIVRSGVIREPVQAPVAKATNVEAPSTPAGQTLRLQHNGQDIDMKAFSEAQRPAVVNTDAEITKRIETPAPAPAHLKLLHNGQEANLNTPWNSHSPTPLKLQHNGKEINMNEFLADQKRDVANYHRIAGDIETPVPAPAPLKLIHNGQEANQNTLWNSDVPPPLQLRHNGKEIDMNEFHAAHKRDVANADAAAEAFKNRQIARDIETPAPTPVPLHLRHNGQTIDVNEFSQAQKYVDRTPAAKTDVTVATKASDASPVPSANAPVRRIESSTPRVVTPATSPAKPVKATDDISAANRIYRVNQTDGLEPRMNDNQRLIQANNLNITNANRAHAVEFRVVKSQKEINSVFAKVFPDGTGPNAEDLRRMLGFSPENGYITRAEFDAAIKFVKEIEKKGGQDYLKNLKLTNDEIDTLNYLTARVPHYARYADASVPTNLENLAKKAPTDATPVAIPPAPKPQISVRSAADEAAIAKVNQVRDQVTDRLEMLNTRVKKPNDRQKETLAIEFSLNENQAKALDWQPIGTRAEVRSILEKAFLANHRVNAQELRKMTAYNPGHGFLNSSNFEDAKRFMKAIEKEGGVEKLNLGNLTKSEKETLNQLLTRVPEYLKYHDPSFSTAIKAVDIDLPNSNAFPELADLNRKLPNHTFKISSDSKPGNGGLTKEALQAAVGFTNGTYAQTAKKLAIELKSLNESQFIKKMEGLVKEGKSRRAVVELKDQNMVRYEFPDGSMVRYMPEGDHIRRGPIYTVEVNKDILPDNGDPSHTAFKVNQKGEPVPRTPRDIQLPLNIKQGSPEEEVFIRTIMDEGHVRLAK